MRDYITSFCKELAYPSEAEQAILSAYDRITANQPAMTLFQKYAELYRADQLTDYSPVFPALDETAELAGAHRYTVHLLFFICLSQHTRELYEKKNIPYDIFYDTLSDLKCKLLECFKMYGIWGSFVAFWFPRFFDLTRFALGRLQFETMEFQGAYSKNGHVINPGDIVLNIHIPSGGALKREDCLASYRKAALFYKEYFTGRPTVFHCHSWLLYPKHREFLPPTSNILRFMEDFDIISSSIDHDHHDMWRIFYKENMTDLSALPRDTSLQRAYADWMCKGNEVGDGTGVFFFDGGNILQA